MTLNANLSLIIPKVHWQCVCIILNTFIPGLNRSYFLEIFNSCHTCGKKLCLRFQLACNAVEILTELPKQSSWLPLHRLYQRQCRFRFWGLYFQCFLDSCEMWQSHVFSCWIRLLELNSWPKEDELLFVLIVQEPIKEAEWVVYGSWKLRRFLM